jgi:hypothetical protein
VFSTHEGVEGGLGGNLFFSLTPHGNSQFCAPDAELRPLVRRVLARAVSQINSNIIRPAQQLFPRPHIHKKFAA